MANKSSLSTYLHNRAFIGERVYNKQRHLGTKAIRVTNPEEEWVVVPEVHEAILPQELFELAAHWTYISNASRLDQTKRAIGYRLLRRVVPPLLEDVLAEAGDVDWNLETAWRQIR